MCSSDLSTEKGYLSGELATLGKMLCAESERQLETLSGSEWEVAARRNVEFFAVGSALLDPAAPLPHAVEGDARIELSRINAASGSEKSTITGDNEDYSQYKPRGYYEGDPHARGILPRDDLVRPHGLCPARRGPRQERPTHDARPAHLRPRLLVARLCRDELLCGCR